MKHYGRFNFDSFIARDNEVIRVVVKARIQPAEPDVGIMSEYVEDVNVYDKDGRPAQVTDKEYEAIMEEAVEQFADSRHEDGDIDDVLDYDNDR
jgi:hypothetical protein